MSNPETRHDDDAFLEKTGKEATSRLEKSFGIDLKGLDKDKLSAIGELPIAKTNNGKEEPLKEADLNAAIDKSIANEASKTGGGVNSEEIETRKSQIMRELSALPVKERILAYCELLKGLKTEVGTKIAEQKQVTDELKKSDEASRRTSGETNDFFRKGQELRKMINEEAQKKIEEQRGRIREIERIAEKSQNQSMKDAKLEIQRIQEVV